MNYRTRYLKQLLSCSACSLIVGNSAFAHGAIPPNLPLHHVAVSFTKVLFPHIGVQALTRSLTKGSLSLLLPKSADHLAAQQMIATIPGSGSLATRQAAALIRSIVATNAHAGEKLGLSQVQFSSSGTAGGTVISGQLQGDVYYVNLTGAIPQYSNAR